jgi:hypothetical protein
MNANKVVKRHIERDSRFQVVQLLAERIGESRKAAKMHSHAQIGPLDVTGRDSFDLRTATDLDWYSVQNLCRRIPVGAFAVLPSVNFDELGVVHFRSEAIFDGGNVGLESVSGELEATSDSVAQITGKDKGALGIPFANVIGQDHLGFAVQGNPSVGIAPFLGIVRAKMSVFRVNVGPEFVSLDKSRPNVPNTRIEKTTAFVADRSQKRKNCGFVDARDARDCADRHSFGQKSDYLGGLPNREIVASKRPMARLREGILAGGAAIALNPVRAVESESLCFGVFATDTGHVWFSLVFLREKPDNQGLGSRCGLRPRLDSARQMVTAICRVFASFLPFTLNVRNSAKMPLARMSSGTHAIGLLRKRSHSALIKRVFGIVKTRNPRNTSINLFALIRQGGFLHFARFSHPSQNHVDSRLRILIFAQVATQLSKLIFDYSRTQPSRICRCEDGANFIGKCGIFKQLYSLGTRLNLNAFAIRQCSQSFKRLSHYDNAKSDLFLPNEQVIQFLLGFLISSNVIIGGFHAC